MAAPSPSPSPPLSLAEIRATMVPKGAAPHPVPSWLHRSWRVPSEFWPQIVGWANERGSALRSEPLARYEPFADLILRHANRAGTAVIWRAASGEFDTLSFASLVERAEIRAAAWRAEGLAPGDSVCIVRQPGLDFAVSLAAALHAGAVFSVISPEGSAYALERIAALGEPWVDAPQTFSPEPFGGLASPPYRELRGEGGAPSTTAPRPVAMNTGAPCARLFDSTAAAAGPAHDVSVDAAMLSALRDGIVALGLSPGERICWPGLPPEEATLLFLAAWAAGAGVVCLAAEDAERSPSLLRVAGAHLVGLNPTLRDRLIELPTHLGDSCRAWMRRPADGGDLQRWQKVVEAAGLEQAGALCVQHSPATAGLLFASPVRRGTAHAEVWPSAGLAHRIVDFIEPSVVSATGHGALAVAPPGPLPAPPSQEPSLPPALPADILVTTTSVIAPVGDGWVYAGNVAQGRCGRAFPAEAVERAALQTKGVVHAQVCIVPQVGDGGPKVDLVLLAEPAAGAAPGAVRATEHTALRQAARRAVAGAVGPSGEVDRVAVFPLLPRRLESGEVDRDFVQRSYLQGILERRAADSLHRALAAIEAIAQAQLDESEPSPKLSDGKP